MSTELRPRLMDDMQEITLNQRLEEELVQRDWIYWCDECKVYHMNPECGWADIVDAALECNVMQEEEQ